MVLHPPILTTTFPAALNSARDGIPGYVTLCKVGVGDDSGGCMFSFRLNWSFKFYRFLKMLRLAPFR